MKKIFTFLLFAFCYFLSSAQLVNNGASIQVNTGAQLLVKGNLTNGTGSNLINNGTIRLSGNLINNQIMVAPNNGMISFEGTSPQAISGSADYYANNAAINNTGGVTLSTRFKIAGECNFISGIISAGNPLYPVLFTPAGSVSSVNIPTDISHVSGYVVKEGTGNFTYPTGNGAKYQKVSTNLTANTNGVSARYISADAGAAPFTSGGASAAPLFAYNAQEYWELTPAGTATGSVTVYWDNYKNSGITNINDLAVAHKSSGAWLNEGAASVTGNILAGSVTGSSISNWSPFTVGSISAASALPIKLQSFTAFASGDNNMLMWSTESEEPNTVFSLQRSEDGRTFIEFSTLPGKGLASDYHAADVKPFSPVTYYRLKISSATGTDVYSSVVPVRRKADGNLNIFPSPAADNITVTNSSLSLNGRVAYITDMQGKNVYSFILRGIQKINIGKLPAGTYLIHLKDGIPVKFVKQ